MEGPDYIQSATWWAAILQLIPWTHSVFSREVHTHICVHKVTLAQTHLSCTQMFPCLFVFFKPRSSDWKGTSRLSGSITCLTLSLHRKDTKNKNQLPHGLHSSARNCHRQEDRVFPPPLMLMNSQLKSWGLSELTIASPFPRLWSLQANIHCGEGVSLRTTGWCLAAYYRIFILVIK